MAFADVYPLAPIPQLSLNDFNVEAGGIFTADVESITDVGNCAAPTPCNTGPTSISPLYLYDDPNSPTSTFQVTDHNGENYLFGYPIISSETVGNDIGELFTVVGDNANYWYYAEGHQTASSFGSVVVIDINDIYLNQVGNQPDATGYIAPLGAAPVPEPASLTLLFGGLAAGLARRRMAGKKA
jgi:hypothetical protein